MTIKKVTVSEPGTPIGASDLDEGEGGASLCLDKIRKHRFRKHHFTHTWMCWKGSSRGSVGSGAD